MTTAPSPVPGYLTTTEAAAHANRAKDHISMLCRTHKLKCVRVGRDWLVEQASLDAYLAGDPRPGPKPKYNNETDK